MNFEHVFIFKDSILTHQNIRAELASIHTQVNNLWANLAYTFLPDFVQFCLVRRKKMAKKKSAKNGNGRYEPNYFVNWPHHRPPPLPHHWWHDWCIQLYWHELAAWWPRNPNTFGIDAKMTMDIMVPRLATFH